MMSSETKNTLEGLEKIEIRAQLLLVELGQANERLSALIRMQHQTYELLNQFYQMVDAHLAQGND